MVLKKYVSQREGDSLNDIFMEFELDELDNLQLNRGGYQPGEGWILKSMMKSIIKTKTFPGLER